MELHEAVRLRDRERSQKKDRDREFPKRRRIERYAMQLKNGGESYRENESTNASEEEYLEEKKDARIHFPNKLDHPPLQSSSLPNNRRNLRTLRSSPVLRSSVDETIGVPIPRRARSTSIKILHDYRNSRSGKLGEDLDHRIETASHICASGASPLASGASMRKKMKSVEPRARALKSTSNPRPSSEIQDNIEIEVVEALFDLMKQSQSQSLSSKNEEKIGKDSVNPADEGLIKGGKEEKKTFLLRYGKSIKVDPETAMDDSIREMKKVEGIEKDKFPNGSAPQGGDGFLNIEKVLSPKENESPSCVKVDACEVQDPKVTRAWDDTTTVVEETKKEAKLKIDLMKSATISNDGPGEGINRLPKLDLEKHYHDKSSVRDGGKQQLRSHKEQKNQSQTSLSPFQISLGGWPSVLPHPGYMQSQQAVLPMDDTARFSIAMQPQKFTFSQPRPKRSTTHQYIARNIQQHQQLITNSLLSGPTGVATLCGNMPPTQG